MHLALHAVGPTTSAERESKNEHKKFIYPYASLLTQGGRGERG
jgi:hypothetical protein